MIKLFTEMADEATGFGKFPGAMEGKDSLEVAEALVDGYLDAADGRCSPRQNFAAARGERDLQIGLAALARCPLKLAQRFQPWEKGRTHRGQQRSAAAAS